MPRVFKRAAVRRDLVEHYVYLAENAGEAIADRFLACAEASFAALSEHPEMGAALTLRRPELAELRKWRIREFAYPLRIRRKRSFCGVTESRRSAAGIHPRHWREGRIEIHAACPLR
jgi:plasmid stabilization system protein ParE